MKENQFAEIEQNMQSIFRQMEFDQYNAERELEEEEKKKRELDIQGYIHQQEKLEEYAKPIEPKSIFSDDFMDMYMSGKGSGDEQEQDLEEDINEQLAHDSIGVTILNGKFTEQGLEAVGSLREDFTPDDMIISDGLAILETFSATAKSLQEMKQQLLETKMDPNDKLIQAIDNFCEADRQKMNGNVTLDDLSKKLSTVTKLGEQYRKDHKPRVRDHKTEESARRYDIMGDLVEKSKVSTAAVNRSIAKVNKNMKQSEKGITPLANMSCRNLGPMLHKKYASDPNRSTVDYVVMSKYNSGMENRVMRSKYYQNLIYKNIKQNTKSSSAIKVDGYVQNKTPLFKGGKYSAYDYAQAYYSKRALDALKNPNMTFGQIKEVARMTEPSNYNKQIKDLAVRPAFKALCKRNPQNALEIWGKLEASNERNLARYRNYYYKLHTAPPEKIIAGLGAKNEVMEESLIVNLAYNSVLADPSNRDITMNMMLMNGSNHKNFASHIDQSTRQALEIYLKNSGIMDKMKGKTVEDYQELVKLLDDPKIHKELSKAARKGAENGLRRVLPKTVAKNKQIQNQRNNQINNQVNRVQRAPGL